MQKKYCCKYKERVVKRTERESNEKWKRQCKQKTRARYRNTNKTGKN